MKEFLVNLNLTLKTFSQNSKSKLLVLSSFQILLSLVEILILCLLVYIAVLAPQLLKKVDKFDSLIPDNLNSIVEFFNISDLNFSGIVGIFLFLFFAKSLLSMFVASEILKVLSKEAENITRRVSMQIFESTEFMLSTKSQDKLIASTSGVDFLVISYISSCILILSDFATLLIIAGGLFFFLPNLAIVTIPSLIALTLILRKTSFKKSQELGLSETKSSSRLNRRFLDLLGIFAELRLSGKTNQALLEFSKMRRIQIEARKGLFLVPYNSKYLMEIGVFAVASIVAATQSLLFGVDAALTSLVALLGTFSRILPTLLRLQSSFINLRAAEGRAYFLIESMKSLHGQQFGINSQDIENKGNFKAEIKVVNLAFTFPGEAVPNLENISIEVNEGEFVAIVGPSGSGKSTLLELILGLRLPSSGNVFVSGIPSKDVYKSYTGLVSYVPQDIVILDATLEQNISLDVNSGVIEEDIERSLRFSGLFDFVQTLRHGTKTEMGEMGSRLSGGQIQRIGIARALYTQPKLIIVDEATSALDGVTEEAIMENLKSIRDQITLLMVAHRLATIRDADKIYYLENGRIRGCGSFEELRKIVPEFDSQATAAGL